jgi:hypothetical protein
MKNFRRFCLAVVLTLALALSSFAGDIGTAGATATPQPQRESSATGDLLLMDAAATGEILAPGAYALDPTMEAALSLLQSLLSLF